MKNVLAFLAISFVLGGCNSDKLFTKIDSESSGITFSNRITENDSINIMKFEYVYNGSGVGIADFNNDGLQDVFFSGNQVSNKLYINKGDFKFEDVSLFAGIEAKDKWCAGVTPVDINNDGLMDVYVAATVKSLEKDRANVLFVNQGLNDGKPVFKEMAEEYGVNDTGHTENSTFFDYDNDGDLDLYVLTNIIDQYPNQFRPKKLDGSHPNTDRLYRCDWPENASHPVYTNVSKEAGILIEGHGLGLNVCDINKDGWKDIYVTNDYLSDDLLYINNQDGTFTNQASKFFKHTSNSAMGNDVGDINNDGYADIIAMDMLAKNNLRKKVLTGFNNYQLYNFNVEYGYGFQYMRNTLQLNNGVDKKNSPMFSEVSLLAGIAETDWSWTPSLADFDNDGYRDLIITNGFPKDVTDRDFMAFRSEVERLADTQFILGQIPEVKIPNYVFRNKGNLEFENVTEQWGMDQPSFSNGAVYADLDNDGDLDYIINNINDSAFVYRNNLEIIDKEKKSHFLRLKFEGDKWNKNGIGAVAEVFYEDGERNIIENNPSRGYLSSVEPFVHFGVGNKKVKSLRVSWYNGLSQIIDNPEIDKVHKIDIKNAKVPINFETMPSLNLLHDVTDSVGIDFVHQEHDFIDYNIQNLLPFKLSELGPGMSVGDINGDGLDDVFMGGGKNKSAMLFLQTASGRFETKYFNDTTKINQKMGEDLGSLLFDADLDGDLDLYVCQGGTESIKETEVFQDKFYVNDSKGNFTESISTLPKFYLSTSCVRGVDIDNDGDLDLVVSGRNVPTEYPKFTSSKILRNDSKKGAPKFTDVTQKIAPELENIGLVCDILCSDFDNDGQTDLILAAEWSDLIFLKNTKGKFSRIKNTGLEHVNGIWSSINGADFDSDGDIDYILGNIGQNTLLKGSKIEPITVLAKDFDNNGVYDLVPFIYFVDENGKKKQVPFNGKDDVNKQINFTRQKFTSYKDFVKADIDNLFSVDQIRDAQKLILNYNSSLYLENQGNGKFKFKDLPLQTQFSPVYGIVIEDFDADGNLDVLLSGNNFGNEVSMGRYDASNGTMLKGDGKGGFKVLRNSGYYVPFDSKSTVTVKGVDNKMLIFAAQNRGPLKVFKSDKLMAVPYKTTNDLKMSFEIKGKKVTREKYYGSTYLGQSSQHFFLANAHKPKNQ